MAVMYRLIHNLEAAIKGKKRSFRNLGKIFTKYLYGGAHFHVKFKSGFIERAAVCILKISRMYSFTGSLKTHVLLFQKFFQTSK